MPPLYISNVRPLKEIIVTVNPSVLECKFQSSMLESTGSEKESMNCKD